LSQATYDFKEKKRKRKREKEKERERNSEGPADTKNLHSTDFIFVKK